MTLSSSVAAYLAFVAENYPAGVPRAAITSSRETITQPASILVVTGGPGELLASEERALLDAAMGRGLGLAKDDYRIVPPSDLTDEVKNLMERTALRAVVTFGEEGAAALSEVLRATGSDEARKDPGPWNGVAFLSTIALGEVVRDPAKKRTLWNDLKKLLP